MEYPRLDEDGLTYFFQKIRPMKLTQDEYDALTESEKMSGRIFFIVNEPASSNDEGTDEATNG